jgi:hypothetical protein
MMASSTVHRPNHGSATGRPMLARAVGNGKRHLVNKTPTISSPFPMLCLPQEVVR